MRALFRRLSGWTAIYAIAVHTILWGIAPFAAGSSADAFSVICHSSVSDASPADRSAPVSNPGRACDHCNLCSGTASLTAPDAGVLNQLAPGENLPVLYPVEIAFRDGLATSPHRARGPPSFA